MPKLARTSVAIREMPSRSTAQTLCTPFSTSQMWSPSLWQPSRVGKAVLTQLERVRRCSKSRDLPGAEDRAADPELQPYFLVSKIPVLLPQAGERTLCLCKPQVERPQKITADINTESASHMSQVTQKTSVLFSW